MGLIGTLCEFVEIGVEPVTFNRTVLVNLVINKEYNVKYEDETSLEYKEFVGNFTNQMEKYYLAKKIANLKEVVVINVRRGGPLVRSSNNTVDEVRLWGKAMAIFSTTPRADSVNVTHDVVLAIPNNASAEQLYNEDVGEIKKAVDGLVGCMGECPNFNATTPPIVNTTEADLGAVCEQFVKDTDVSKYYELVHIDGTMTCVTVCHSRHSDHKRCYNRGICIVYKASGPLCMCHDVDATWYLKDDCSFPIHRIAFYAGLSGTLACLLVTVGVLTAFILRNKQRQKRRRDKKEKMVIDQWLNEDFEWTRPSTDVDNDGDIDNPVFTYDESATYREDLSVSGTSLATDDRRSSSSDTPYRHTTLTTNTLSFSNAGEPQSASPPQPQRDLSSSTQPMRISRPQIKMFWSSSC